MVVEDDRATARWRRSSDKGPAGRARLSAFVWGAPDAARTIDSRSTHPTRAKHGGARGRRAAVTIGKVLERYRARTARMSRAARLPAGDRPTHQIRVHLASIGHRCWATASTRRLQTKAACCRTGAGGAGSPDGRPCMLSTGVNIP